MANSVKSISLGNKESPHVEPALLISHRITEADKIAAISAGQAPITPEELRAVRRRIDWIILPWVMLLFGVSNIDKTIFSTGALFGELKDLDLIVGKNTSRYSNVASLFYVGFALGNYPFAALGQRYPINKVISFAVVGWSIVLMLQCACTSYPGILVARFVQGILEGGITPTLALVTSMWYQKQEQPFRIALWYGSGVLMSGFSQLVAYGLVHITSPHVKIWQILFIFFGGCSLLLGVSVWFFMPASPLTTTRLTERQRYVAVERLREKQDSIQNHHIKSDHVIDALKDPKTWMILVLSFCVILPNGLGNTFTPIIIRQSLGFSATTTLLLLFPYYVFAAIVPFFFGFICSHYKGVRVYALIGSMALCFTGMLILWKTSKTNIVASFFGLYLAVQLTPAVVVLISLVSTNTGGTTKKTIVYFFYFIGYSAGNIGGPLIFIGNQAPTYTGAYTGNVVSISVAIVMAIVYRLYCVRENKRRDAMGAIAQQDHAFMDETDRVNLSFRYAV